MINNGGVVFAVGYNSGATVIFGQWIPLKGIVLSESTFSVDEGTSATYTVKLSVQPTSGVKVRVRRDIRAITVNGGDSQDLTFTTSTWNMGQTITVAALEDVNAVNGDVTIQHTTVKADTADEYDNAISNLRGTVTDDDAAIVVSRGTRALPLTEGSAATYTVTLKGQPAGNVVVQVTSDDAGAVTVGPGSLTFTTSTWNTAQTVTARAVEDADGTNETVTVTHAVDDASSSNEFDPADDVTFPVTVTDDDPTVTLALAPATITEEGGVTTVTATLNRVSSAATTITVAAAPVAASGAVAEDFVLSTNTVLTVVAGQTASTGTGNAVDAPDKTVRVTGTAANTQGLTQPTAVEVTLTDDEALPTVTLAVSPTAVTENGGMATVTATLSGKSSEAVRLTVAATAVAPAVAGDFTLSGMVLTIAAEATTSTGTVTLTAADNAVDAPNKTVDVTATPTGGHGVAAPGTLTVTLTDDDATPTVTLAVSSTAITEEGGVATVTATLNRASSAATTIMVAAPPVAPSGAVASDFTLSTTTVLTVAAGQTASTGTVTLTDDDAAPTVTLAVTPATITEEGGVTTVTATLNRVSSAATTVTVTAAAVPPAVAGDFTQSGTMLTVAAGQTTSTGTVTVTANGNTVDAPNKTVRVTGTAANTQGIVQPTAVEVTVTDDEALPTVTLAVAPTAVAENGGVATVTATLSGESSQAVTLTVTATAVSPAVAGDFTLSMTPVLTITAGQTTSTGTVTVTAADNVVDAAAKTVTIAATAAGGHGVTAPGDATLTLTDDDTAGVVAAPTTGLRTTESGGTATFTVRLATEPTGTVVLGLVSTNTAEGTVAPPTLTFAAADWATAKPVTVTAVNQDNEYGLAVSAVTGQATESGGPAAFTVALQTEPTAAVTVAVASQDPSEGVAAPERLLFTLTPTTWNTAQPVTVTGQDDDVDDEEQPYAVRLTPSSSDPNYNTLAPEDVTVTTTDDEPRPTVTLAVSSAAITEAGGVTTVTATLSGKSSEAVRLTVAATAVAPAEAGDFTLSGTVLTIAAEATTSTGTVTLTGVDNAVDAPNKEVRVTATAAGGHGVAAPGALTVTLTDEDATPTVTLAVSPTAITESAGVTTVTATLNRASSAATTVTVTAAPVAASGAVAGDFTQSGTVLTIAAGQTTSTGTVTGTGVGNAVNAPDKTVRVTGTAGNTHGITQPSPVLLTLMDDDAAPTVANDETLPTVRLAVSSTAITEAGGVTTVTATLSGKSSQSVTLTATAVAPAVAGDFTQSGTVLTIAAETTTSTGMVTLTAVDNAVDAPNKTMEVTAAAGGNGVAAPDALTVTITDDDATPTVTLVLTPPAITENGDVATVTATLTDPSIEATTVTVTATPVAPAVPRDFMQNGTELVIAAKETTSTGVVTLIARDNDVDADDKTVRVAGTAANALASNDGMTVTATTLTLTDDDERGLAFNPAALVVAAGNTAAYTVQLTSEPTGNVTVTLAPDAAVTVDPTSLTFTAMSWATAQPVTLTVAADTTARANLVEHRGTGGDYEGETKTLVVARMDLTMIETGEPIYTRGEEGMHYYLRDNQLVIVTESAGVPPGVTFTPDAPLTRPLTMHVKRLERDEANVAGSKFRLGLALDVTFTQSLPGRLCLLVREDVRRAVGSRQVHLLHNPNPDGEGMWTVLEEGPPDSPELCANMGERVFSPFAVGYKNPGIDFPKDAQDHLGSLHLPYGPGGEPTVAWDHDGGASAAHLHAASGAAGVGPPGWADA